jgi:hypothetical protein
VQQLVKTGDDEVFVVRLDGTAYAGCFSMAFSLMLENAGFPPKRIVTRADVAIENAGQGFAISSIKLSTEAEVPRIQGIVRSPTHRAGSQAAVSVSCRLIGGIRLSGNAETPMNPSHLTES